MDGALKVALACAGCIPELLVAIVAVILPQWHPPRCILELRVRASESKLKGKTTARYAWIQSKWIAASQSQVRIECVFLRGSVIIFYQN